MNAHLPRSIETAVELRYIAIVPQQIISPASCSAIITIIQDTLTGSYLLTQDGIKVYEEEINNIMMNVKDFTGILPKEDGIDEQGRKYWKGGTVFSMILPDLSIKKTNNSDKQTIIKNGTYICGQLDKSLLGSRGLIQQIFNMYDSERCKRFMNSTQSMITRWLENHSFTIGLGDCVLEDEEIKKKIDEILDQKIHEANLKITEAYQGVYEPNLDIELRRKSLENDILNILAQGSDEAVKYIKSKLPLYNSFNVMVTSGSKGKKSNIQQVMGVVGQQMLWGDRVRDGFTNRTLPHFHKFDFGPLPKGFVKSSFIRGLNPAEFFFQMMGGRTGNIDTAVRTAESGYISRRLMKAMEDLQVTYDGTVRNAIGNIVQTCYGDDNFDPIKLERVKVDLVEYDNIQMKERYKFEIENDKDWSTILMNNAVTELLKDKEYKKKLDKEFDDLMMYRDLLRHRVYKNIDILNVDTYMPFNLHRFIPAVKFKMNIQEYNVSDISPTYIIDKVNELCDDIIKTNKDPDSQLLMRILIKSFLNSKLLIVKYKLNKMAFDYILQMLNKKITEAYVQPGEMVGPVAAQSCGEISTQLTLNSVEYNEKILIRDNDMNTCKAVKIGEFIDNIIENTKDQTLLEKHPNDTTLRWTKDTNNYQVISVNEDGKIEWENIEAVTKHPPMNKDGTATLVKITTRMGRTVIATKAKSFLTRKDNKIVPIRGDEIKIGDYVPIMKNFPNEKNILLDELSLEKYLPKNKYIWGNEINKALEYRKTERLWFKKGHNKIFTTPFSRSDSLYDSTKETKIGYGKRRRIIKENMIYEKIGYSNGLPDTLKLDRITGFFFGAYLAEGLATEYYVSISNNNDTYREQIINFCNLYQQTYHIQRQENKIKNGWNSIDIRIHSKMIASIMKQLCNTGSANKKLPDFAYLANDNFVIGLLDGYFSGDGCVSLRNTIDATSTSENIIDGIMLLLSRYDIFCKKNKPKKIEKNNRGSKNIKQHYTLQIKNGNVLKFAKKIKLCIDKKQERLDTLLKTYKPWSENGKFDYIPDLKTSFNNKKIHRKELKAMLSKNISKTDLEIINKTLNENIYYDEILKIEEVLSEHSYVYDLTVSNTKNFVMLNGLCMRDTFHSAGQAAGSVVVTMGVPRMKEIINLSKNIKTPSVEIYLEQEYADDRQKAEEIKNLVEYTKLSSIVAATEFIYEDPDLMDINPENDEDYEFMKIYKEFNDLVCTSNNDNLSKWVLRLEFDREAMMNKNIYMTDVQNVILMSSNAEDYIQCVISDDNSNNLIMRIKIRLDEQEEDFLTFMKDLEKEIMNLTIKGIRNIKSANVNEYNVTRYNPDGSYYTTKPWKITTDGSNLVDILSMDHVDTTRTISNDLYEIYEIFGVEAVRSKIIQELNKVFDESKINQRHVALLADIMTYRGVLMQIDRHGINRSPDNSVISKATFEEVTDMFVKASTFAEVDKMNGVSASVMFGQPAKCGTNVFDLVIDEEMIINDSLDDDELYIPEGDLDEEEVQQRINDMYEDMPEELQVNDDDFDFGYSLEYIQQREIGPPPVLLDDDTDVLQIVGDTKVSKKKEVVKKTTGKKKIIKKKTTKK